MLLFPVAYFYISFTFHACNFIIIGLYSSWSVLLILLTFVSRERRSFFLYTWDNFSYFISQLHFIFIYGFLISRHCTIILFSHTLCSLYLFDSLFYIIYFVLHILVFHPLPLILFLQPFLINVHTVQFIIHSSIVVFSWVICTYTFVL